MADEKKTVKMLGAYILMRRDKAVERKSPGGIVMPAPAAANPTWGNVIGVGPDAAMQLAIGDRVLVGKFAGTDVQIDDEPAVVVRLEDVYGVERVGEVMGVPGTICG